MNSELKLAIAAALIGLTALIVLVALLIAIAARGDPAAISRAQGNLANAEVNIAAGHFARAILDYKKAWMNAVKAL